MNSLDCQIISPDAKSRKPFSLWVFPFLNHWARFSKLCIIFHCDFPLNNKIIFLACFFLNLKFSCYISQRWLVNVFKEKMKKKFPMLKLLSYASFLFSLLFFFFLLLPSPHVAFWKLLYSFGYCKFSVDIPIYCYSIADTKTNNKWNRRPRSNSD